jgi:hypothetical protein
MVPGSMLPAPGSACQARPTSATRQADGVRCICNGQPFNIILIIGFLTMALQANGTALPSMVRFMLEEDSALPAEQSQAETIKGLAAVAYLAGSDTTVGAVISFFLAMLVYPNVQAKAQAEIDRVVGKDRLPEPEDAENMPYVQAIANECLRWLPVAPTGSPFLHKQRSLALYGPRIGIAHSIQQDDEYNGYLIPKGSIVMGSVWSVHPIYTPCFMADRILGLFYTTPKTIPSRRLSSPSGISHPKASSIRMCATLA